MLHAHGFAIEKFEVGYGKELKNFDRQISSALTLSASNLNIPIDNLPIIQLVVAKKAN
jgi:hypothetical protein